MLREDKALRSNLFRPWLLPAVAGAMVVSAVVGGAHPAAADPQIYEYRVAHPVYGNIGTYTNVVQQAGDSVDVETKLHIVVKFLGLVVHRQEADRREHWTGDRLIEFKGVTETNGEKLEVTGEARDDGFVITSPSGTITAPASVHPSNPWSASLLNGDLMMSTKSGKLFKVAVTGSKEEVVTTGGTSERLREIDIHGDKRQAVWLDEHGVPVAFRTEEGGTPVDFVLTRYPSGAPQLWAGPASAGSSSEGEANRSAASVQTAARPGAPVGGP